MVIGGCTIYIWGMSCRSILILKVWYINVSSFVHPWVVILSNWSPYRIWSPVVKGQRRKVLRVSYLPHPIPLEAAYQIK